MQEFPKEHTLELLNEGSDVGKYGTITLTMNKEDAKEKAERDQLLQEELTRLLSQKEFLNLTVDKCNNLKDLETMSTSDPYVSVALVQSDGTESSFKTSAKDGNLNPEYGETFEFESNAAQRHTGEHEARLVLTVWDDNSVSDDLMGQVTINLSQLAGGSGTQTLTLLDGKGREDGLGSVTISFITFSPEDREAKLAEKAKREEARKQRLEALSKQVEFVAVKIVACADLKDLETVSTSDPFVKVILKQPNGTIQEYKTAVKDGELNPKYNETFEFNSNAAMRTAGELEATLIFQVWDQNNVSDDLMGQISFPLSDLAGLKAAAEKSAAAGDQVVNLDSEKGKSLEAEFGTLTYNVKVETQEEKDKRQEADAAREASRKKQLDEWRQEEEWLTIQIVKCANLKDLETMSTSDPYVKLVLKQPNGAQEKLSELKTLVKDGELNPEYGETFEFQSNKAQWMSGDYEATLAFEVWDDNSVSDDLMGQIAFPLSQFSMLPKGDTVVLRGSKSETGEFGTLTYTARRETGQEKANRIQQEVERAQQRKVELEKMQKKKEVMTVKVVSCANLMDLESMSTSDPYVKLMLKQPNGIIQEFKTAVKDGELNPKYNETFKFNINPAMRTVGMHEATFTFQVWDDNSMSDDLMGQIVFPLSQFALTPKGDTVTLLGEKLKAGKYGTLTYIAGRTS